MHGNHFTINRIKSREPWRPLAPVTKQEYFSQFFGDPMNDFMLTFAHVKSSSLPAISHVDNTARVQIIREEEHPVYHLLTKIHEKTNCLQY